MSNENDVRQKHEETDTAGEWVMLALGRWRQLVDVAVDTSGAATLTVEFSHEETFTGEEISPVSVDYDAATEQIEQFPTGYAYVRAKVDQNLNTLGLTSKGEGA